jgi:hypothetical protein
MKEAERPSEMLVNFYQTTRRYNPEDSHLLNTVTYCNIYLGMKINEGGRHSIIQGRINLGRYAISTMNGVVWDKRVTMKTKQNIYKIIIKCIVLHCSEKRHFKKETKIIGGGN